MLVGMAVRKAGQAWKAVRQTKVVGLQGGMVEQALQGTVAG